VAVGDRAVGGLMSLPAEARKAGATPRWVGYVDVADVDAAAGRVARLGGVVHVPPIDIPDVSRIAIVADPQMAMFGLITWLGADEERPTASGGPGRAGWHELLAADSDTAFPFYADLLGWQKAGTGVDPGGTYQLFSSAGQTIGGMFAKPATAPVAFWLYYFGVADIHAAVERTRAAGGEILEGPVDVMGDAEVVRCVDPQGAMFALIGPRSKNAAGYFERSASRSPSPARGRRWSW
jgi:predicted enzyme related to lactoylglutathione lyase